MSPARQAAIGRAHTLIQNLKLLYIRLWDAPDDSVQSIVEQVNRAADALSRTEYEHEALMTLINEIGFATLIVGRQRAGRDDKAIAEALAARVAAGFRRSFPEFGARLARETNHALLATAIRAFAHRAGRGKPTGATKWDAIAAVARKAGLQAPDALSIKRMWARWPLERSLYKQFEHAEQFRREKVRVRGGGEPIAGLTDEEIDLLVANLDEEHKAVLKETVSWLAEVFESASRNPPGDQVWSSEELRREHEVMLSAVKITLIRSQYLPRKSV